MKEKLNKKENKMSMNVLMLESVGSCVDCNGMTYPLNTDGTPDELIGIKIESISTCDFQ